MRTNILFKEEINGVRASRRIVYCEDKVVKEVLFEDRYDSESDNIYSIPYAINELGQYAKFEHHPSFIDLDDGTKYHRFLRAVMLDKTRRRDESFFKLLNKLEGYYVECPARRTPLVPKGYKSIVCYSCHAVAFKTYDEVKDFFKELRKMVKKI